MKEFLMLALAVLIGVCSVAGLVFAWAGSITSLDAMVALQSACFLGFFATGKLIISAGDSADETASQAG